MWHLMVAEMMSCCSDRLRIWGEQPTIFRKIYFCLTVHALNIVLFSTFLQYYTCIFNFHFYILTFFYIFYNFLNFFTFSTFFLHFLHFFYIFTHFSKSFSHYSWGYLATIPSSVLSTSRLFVCYCRIIYCIFQEFPKQSTCFHK